MIKRNAVSVGAGVVVSGGVAKVRRRGLALVALAVAASASVAAGQITYTLNTTGTTNDWLSTGNWSSTNPGTFPGLSLNGSLSNGAATDIAVIGANDLPTLSGGSTPGLSIDFTAAGANGQLSLGAVVFNNTSAPAVTTLSKTDGSTATGVLRLNGATVNVGGTGGSLSNVVLSVNDDATGDFEIAPTNAGTNGTISVALGGNSTVYVASGRNAAIRGGITEANPGAALTKRGVGQLTLDNTVNVTGGYINQEGTTAFTGNVNLAGGVTVPSSATSSNLIFNNTSTAAFSGGLSINAGSFNINSPTASFTGGLSINNAIGLFGSDNKHTTFDGGVTVTNSGRVTFGVATHQFTGGVNVSSDGTVVFSGGTGASAAFSGGVVATGGFVNLAPSVLAFNGGIQVSGGLVNLAPGNPATAWSGGATVSGTGTLALSNGVAMNQAGGGFNTVTMNGGTLDTFGATANVALGSTPVIVNSNFTWGGSGNGGLARNLTLGTTTLNGTTTITATGLLGALILGPVVNGSSTGAIVKNGPGAIGLGGSGTFSGGVTLNAGGLYINSNSTTVQATGVVTAGPLGTGPLTINGGIIASASATAFDAAANLITVNNDFQVGLPGTGRITLIGSIDLTGSTRTITLGRNIPANSLTGSNFAAAGLRFQSISSPTVGTRITNGTLRLAAAANVVAPDYTAVTFNGTVLFPGNTGLVIGPRVVTTLAGSGPFGTTVGNQPALTVEAGGYFNTSDGTNFTRSVAVFSLSGSGVVTNLAYAIASGTNRMQPITINNNGSATFDGQIADGAEMAVNFPNLTGTNTLTGIMSVAMAGTGTQTFTGASTYTGPTQINSGNLAITSLPNSGVAGPLGAGSQERSVIQLRGGTLRFVNTADVSSDRQLLMTTSGGGISAFGTAPVTINYTGAFTLGETYGRTVPLNAGSNLIAGIDTNGISVGQAVSGPGIAPGTTVSAVSGTTFASTVTLSGTVSATASAFVSFSSTLTNTRTFTLSGVSLFENVFRPQLTNAVNYPLGLTKSGTTTWTLTNNNTYTGPTSITGGTLKLAAGASLNPASVITVGDAGTFDPAPAFPGGYPVIAGQTFNYNGVVTVPVLNSGLVQNTTATGTSTSVGGTITGTGNYNKTGGGTVTYSTTWNLPTVSFSGGASTLTSAASVTAPSLNVFSNATLDVTALPGGLVRPVGSVTQMNGPIAGNIVNAGTIVIGTNSDRTYPANISGTGGINKVDGISTSTMTGSLTYTGNTTISAGKLILNTPLKPVTGSLAVSGQTTPSVLLGAVVMDPNSYASPSVNARVGEFSAVSVGSSGQTGVSTLEILAVDRGVNKPAVLVTGSLFIAPDSGSSLSGFVDLGNGDMVIKGGAATESTVRSHVKAWLDSGSTKVGLGASSATAVTTLAVYSNDSGFGFPEVTSFDGVTVGASDLLVKYTYLGDTNIDGLIDARDVNQVLNGWTNGLTGWKNGDTNYDGVIDGVDYTNVLAALSGQGAPLDGNPTGGSNAIPEPAALGLLAAGLPLVTRRRRVAR